MKIRIHMKTPDAVEDAVAEAVKSGASGGEDSLADFDEQMEKLSKWIKYGEYIAVEFDTDAMTAAVVPCK